MKGIYFNIGLLLLIYCPAAAQTAYNLAGLLEKNKILTTSYSQTYALKGDKPGAIRTSNMIWFKEIEFTEGKIDIDLRGKDEFMKSFLGIAFHGTDTAECDILYFRPFNFKHEDTSRHYWSVQYVSLPENGWPRLRKEHPRVYENTVHPVPDPNGWFHATIIIKDGLLKVFVNHAPQPSLEVHLLNDRKGSKLGLYSDGEPADFANLSIQHFQPGKEQVTNYNLPQLWHNHQLAYTNANMVRPAGSTPQNAITARGLVLLKGVSFSEGTIEIDLKGKDVFQGSFLGIAFHVKDTFNYEVVYCRPFNFHSTDSIRKKHAVQYVCFPDYTWDKLRNEYPDAYESPIKQAPLATDWFHLKITVKEKWITVYINHSPVPSLQIKSLNNNQTGGIGLWTDPNIEPDMFAGLGIKYKV